MLRTTFALVVAVAVQGTLLGSAIAQDPADPTTQTEELTPTLELTVGGPEQASAGSTTVYTVNYRVLDSTKPTWTFRAFIEQPLSFVSVQLATGAGSCVFTATEAEKQNSEGAVDCTVGNIDAQSGGVEVTVKVAEAFQGDVVFTAFVPGASIDMGDSVLSAATRIVASGDTPMPSAATAPEPAGESAWPGWLAGLGIAAILVAGAGAVLVARRR